jgi:hypothetical protein
MGNQGYSNEGTRQCAEMIWAGEIGNVTEVHAWTDRPLWPQGLTKIPAPTPVVDGLDWDLWLGSAMPRPFTVGGEGYPNSYGNFYQPFNWRGFYDFGCGALGDMACHILGAPNMALKLGSPTSVECIKKEGVSDFMFPKKSIIRFDFPARGNMPAVKLFWYDGLETTPELPGVPKGEYLGDLPSANRGGRGGRGRGAAGAEAAPATPPAARPPAPKPNGFVGGVFDYEAYQAVLKDPNPRIPKPDGSVFIGDKGIITHPGGENGRLQIPSRIADAFAGPLSGLDPRLQGRRSGMLQFQRGCAICRMDAARGDRSAGRRQDRIRSREDEDHQQRRRK